MQARKKFGRIGNDITGKTPAYWEKRRQHDMGKLLRTYSFSLLLSLVMHFRQGKQGKLDNTWQEGGFTQSLTKSTNRSKSGSQLQCSSKCGSTPGFDHNSHNGASMPQTPCNPSATCRSDAVCTIFLCLRSTPFSNLVLGTQGRVSKERREHPSLCPSAGNTRIKGNLLPLGGKW